MLYRFGNVLRELPVIEGSFIVINFGGGFFSCGEAKLHTSSVEIAKEESFQVGGEMIVRHIMGIVNSKGFNQFNYNEIYY